MLQCNIEVLYLSLLSIIVKIMKMSISSICNIQL